MPETVACGLCGSAEATLQELRTRLVQMPSPYEIKRCGSCGFEYLSPRPTRDELLDLYAVHPWYRGEPLAARSRRRNFDRARLERVERWTGGPGSLLAVGAMEGGWVMDNAKRRGWEVVGVEFIPSLLKAEATREVEMVHSSLWSLDALNGRRFDAIHTLSLEHVPDVLQSLAAFREVLKPGGVVVVEAPNQFEGLKERFKEAVLAVLGERILPFFWAEAGPYFHLSFFTPRTLRNALDLSGFEILESRTYLPWNPVYHHTQRLRTLREASFVLGSLVERGPSIEVIARPAT